MSESESDNLIQMAEAEALRIHQEMSSWKAKYIIPNDCYIDWFRMGAIWCKKQFQEHSNND